VRTIRDPKQRGGVVIIDVPNIVPELAKREVLVDYRPQAGIRIAPHFYTTDDELDHTIKEIQKIVCQK